MEWPDNYDYHIVNSNEIRTPFKTKDEVEAWIYDLEEISKNTWYISRTIHTPPEKARQHVFKRVYHCHFRTKVNKLKEDRKRKHSSRNTNCPAELVVIIKKQEFHPRTKPRVVDKLLKNWPCVIIVKGVHNHSVDLTKRPIGAEAKQQILQLFDEGHSVASAYNRFCCLKMEQLGEKYDELECDRHYFPSKDDFGNLWKSHFKRGDNSVTKDTTMEELPVTIKKEIGTEEFNAEQYNNPIVDDQQIKEEIIDIVECFKQEIDDLPEEQDIKLKENV